MNPDPPLSFPFLAKRPDMLGTTFLSLISETFIHIDYFHSSLIETLQRSINFACSFISPLSFLLTSLSSPLSPLPHSLNVCVFSLLNELKANSNHLMIFRTFCYFVLTSGNEGCYISVVKLGRKGSAYGMVLSSTRFPKVTAEYLQTKLVPH